MPVHIRNFYYKQLFDAKKAENAASKNAKAKNIPKSPSKVRVNR
jgi:hypothetical protein